MINENQWTDEEREILQKINALGSKGVGNVRSPFANTVRVLLDAYLLASHPGGFLPKQPTRSSNP